MSVPVSILEPTIGAVMDGRCRQLWRPLGGMYAHCPIGDRLWVREAFYLSVEFERVAPTVAEMRGALPTFAADITPAAAAEPGWLGKRRMARMLPKVWHRQHLVVTGKDTRRLQSITEAEARAQGFEDMSAFAEAWDRMIQLSGWGFEWAQAPLAVVLEFEHVLAALPREAAEAREHVCG